MRRNGWSSCHCFNEAEAIKPRKPTAAINNLQTMLGFNEAEAIKPRKLRPTTTSVVTIRASMRPRQSSLGNDGSSGDYEMVTRPIAGFNEAEAIKPRKP